MVKLVTKGNFKKTFGFFERTEDMKLNLLEKYAKEGVRALSEATPKDSGKTADSWYYVIKEGDGYYAVEWCNSNLGDGWAPIALLLQYGHATGTGGYVQGRDYINPAIQPIFDKMAKDAWEEVTK